MSPLTRDRLQTPRRIGLLGGSFNPAHDGHLHISRMALEKLGLDEVWWLVSPQNPLKDEDDMAYLPDRMAAARGIARVEPKIKVLDLERQIETTYTIDTLNVLKTHFPAVGFVWLMGADILIEMPKWKNWRRIFHTVPIAVFARPSYSFRALSSRAARVFAGGQRRMSRANTLASARLPAWVFMKIPTHAASATALRRVKPDAEAEAD